MSPNFGYLTSFLSQIANLIRTLIPLLFAAAILVFFYGLVVYIWKADKEEEQKAAKWYMVWSIVALVVMASVYGLIGVVQGIFGINTGSPTNILPPNI